VVVTCKLRHFIRPGYHFLGGGVDQSVYQVAWGFQVVDPCPVFVDTFALHEPLGLSFIVG